MLARVEAEEKLKDVLQALKILEEGHGEPMRAVDLFASSRMSTAAKRKMFEKLIEGGHLQKEVIDNITHYAFTPVAHKKKLFDPVGLSSILWPGSEGYKGTLPPEPASSDVALEDDDDDEVFEDEEEPTEEMEESLEAAPEPIKDVVLELLTKIAESVGNVARLLAHHHIESQEGLKLARSIDRRLKRIENDLGIKEQDVEQEVNGRDSGGVPDESAPDAEDEGGAGERAGSVPPS